jgi:hypothetical protein
MVIDWNEVFDESYPLPGTSEEAIARLIESIGNPLTVEEIATVNKRQRNPYSMTHAFYAGWRPIDPTTWCLPVGSLPSDYLSLLRWSNGGEFRTGAQWLQIYPAADVRQLLLDYHVPQYLSGALSIASDGGGHIYAFDMRRPYVHGEYPILVVAAGDQGYDTAVVAARSFMELCRNTVSASDLLRTRAVILQRLTRTLSRRAAG